MYAHIARKCLSKKYIPVKVKGNTLDVHNVTLITASGGWLLLIADVTWRRNCMIPSVLTKKILRYLQYGLSGI